MNRKIAVVVGIMFASLAGAAQTGQDKYTLKVPGRARVL